MTAPSALRASSAPAVAAAALVSALVSGPLACDGPAPDRAAAGAVADTMTVEMRDMAFRAPGGGDTVRVPPGQPIRFVNLDAAPHTVTSTSAPDDAGFGSGRLDEGDEFVWTPDREGRWVYRCDFHPGTMQGAVVQVAGEARGDGAADEPGPPAPGDSAPDRAANAGGAGEAPPGGEVDDGTGDTVTVEVGDFFFRGPDESGRLTLEPGQTVAFVNRGDADHTVTSVRAPGGGAFDSGDLEPGRTFHWTPSRTGEWSYVCDFHEEMTGRITVAGEDGAPEGARRDPDATPPRGDEEAAAAVVEIDDEGFRTLEATVPAGRPVTWVNVGTRVHTVSATDAPEGGGRFDSEELRPGESFTFVPPMSGTWEYRCDEHSDERPARLRATTR